MLKYTIVTDIAYPFGGGEEYMSQTCIWLKKYKYTCTWLAFCNSTRKIFEGIRKREIENCVLIDIPEGYNDKTLEEWLKLLRPDIVHHQGGMRERTYNVCEKLNIKFMSGFHFWIGGIQLDPIKNNTLILENAEYHKPDEEFLRLKNKKNCNMYVVSEFVAECFKKIANVDMKNILYPSSSIKNNKINYDVNEAKYVTIINIHKYKGGDIVLELIKSLKHISFLCIKTEPNSEELDDKIKQEILMRKDDEASCFYMERQNNLKFIFNQTKILLQFSIVDETFCRVVNEAMLNGIPVISTGYGNIKNLMGNQGIYVDPCDVEKIKNTINDLYCDKQKLSEYSKYLTNEYVKYSEEKAETQFINYIDDIINKKEKESLMMYVPWCDQGLGIQAKNYNEILKNIYNVCIFSYKPYIAKTCKELQKEGDGWEIENVYYSNNDREHVTDIEIIEFVKKYNITKCIIPETCWFRVFDIAKKLREISVKVYAIPNIEIVRKDELVKHEYFHKILCNNELCKNIFEKYGIKRTHHIGYNINRCDLFKHKKIDNKIKFLFIGGMNAFSRKQILKICEGFKVADNDNATLTCTILRTNSLETDDINNLEKYRGTKNINIIEKHLSYETIINLHHDHNVVIHVSKHEGLGLGFYEAMATGTPVLTLNTQPHNEIIKNNYNGWTINCFYIKMTDNKDPLFDSANFNHNDLAEKINYVTNNYKEIYNQVKNNIIEFNTNNFNMFTKEFISALST